MISAQRKGTVDELPIRTAKLLALLRYCGDARTAEVAAEFRSLHRLVACLPLTTEEFCFAHNWLTSAHDLWQAGDWAAACFQVNLVAKKLTLTEKLHGTGRSQTKPIPRSRLRGKGDPYGPN
jgi:hypothetical protein